MRPRRRALAPTALTALLAFASASGCGGEDEGPGPGETVWTADVKKLVIASAGGGLFPTPPGSECAAGSSRYELEVTSLHLASVTCENDGSALHELARQRTLTAAELGELTPALERLIVVEEQTCGADKPEITLTVTSTSGTREYRDSFYSCLDDPRPTIASSALDEVMNRLRELASPSAR